HLKLDNYKRKFIILFFVVTIAPFVEFSASDTIATVLCLWGFYFNLKYQKNEKYKNVLFSLISLGIAYFVKYSFLPFLLYPILSFILKEKANTFKRLKEFLIIFSTTIAAVLFFYILNYLIVGKMQIASSFDVFKGNIHWNQLSHFNGFLFVFGSVYQWVFENLIKNHLGISFHFNWLSILITIYFYYLFIKEFFSKKNLVQNSAIQNSINISLSAGALIIGFLTFLTLNDPGQTWTKPYWTFVQETRYYGPVIIIGLINILILFFAKKKGTLLHIIVPLMIVLNLYGYRTAIQSGFWGKNYNSYLSIKNDMNKELPQKNKLQVPVVFFNKDTKNSDPYYYLQSQGIILLEENKSYLGKNRDNKFIYYSLNQDSANKINITLIN
ncbi:MAG TPA: hypothetical protein VFI29_03220, partial [Hanamia sp.]|nr:hypothetical protein [Hanamia sp.]